MQARDVHIIVNQWNCLDLNKRDNDLHTIILLFSLNSNFLINRQIYLFDGRLDGLKIVNKPVW